MNSNLIERYVAPVDASAGCFVGRAWVPEDRPGPSVMVLKSDRAAYDIGEVATMSDLIDKPDPAAFARAASGVRVGSVEALLSNSDPQGQDPDRPWLLSPVDLQASRLRASPSPPAGGAGGRGAGPGGRRPPPRRSGGAARPNRRRPGWR